MLGRAAAGTTTSEHTKQRLCV